MAVVLTCRDGCILDHERAITTAYKSCIIPPALYWSHPLSSDKPAKEILESHGEAGEEFLDSQDKHKTMPVLCSAAWSNGQPMVSYSKDLDFGAEEPRVESPSVHAGTEAQYPSEIERNIVSHVTETAISDAKETSHADATTSAKTVSQHPSEGEMHIAFDLSKTGTCDANNKSDSDAASCNIAPLTPISTRRISGCDCDEETGRRNDATHGHEPLNNQSAYVTSLDLAKTATQGQNQQSASVSGLDLAKTASLGLRHDFFAINVPFMMDGQFEKVNTAEEIMNKNIVVADIKRALSRKRKKKRKMSTRSNKEERLHEVCTSLVCTAREQNIFLRHIPLPLDNNLLSRQCAQLDHHGDIFAGFLVTDDWLPLLHMGEAPPPLVLRADGCRRLSAADLLHRRVSHEAHEASVINVEGTSFVLPPYSQFLLSNLQDFNDHLHSELDESGYDLVVLDPPWENKSVKRKKCYNMSCEAGLVDLPIRRLTRHGSLVALWVTNNERLEAFALDTLFPAWGLRVVGIWHWVKVTRTGDLITSLDEGHKKPYETLLLGRCCWRGGDALEQAEDSREDEVEGRGEEVPEHKVFISVPCSLHSKKPPLEDILRPHLPTGARCLELFARNLWPGWTSWGREALKHQNLLYFEKTERQ